ncbi:hypothetical protein GFJ90_18600, partial [Salmonella enterica subsp. enterica serovar Enteritidis]|nr:hypothetical protein [Salmonella enterica subsp. enterica serovar Enteritidis]
GPWAWSNIDKSKVNYGVTPTLCDLCCINVSNACWRTQKHADFCGRHHEIPFLSAPVVSGVVSSSSRLLPHKKAGGWRIYPSQGSRIVRPS